MNWVALPYLLTLRVAAGSFFEEDDEFDLLLIPLLGMSFAFR